MNQLPVGYDVVVDTADVSRPIRSSDAVSVDASWFSNALAVLTNTAHLRLRRRIDPLHTTVQEARELILGVRDAVDAARDAWWDLARSVDYIKDQPPTST